jgi:hypothetical protein
MASKIGAEFKQLLWTRGMKEKEQEQREAAREIEAQSLKQKRDWAKSSVPVAKPPSDYHLNI